jgi:hypothetical protein
MLGALYAGVFSVFVVSLLPGGGAYAVLASLSALLPGFLSGAFVRSDTCRSHWARSYRDFRFPILFLWHGRR